MAIISTFPYTEDWESRTNWENVGFSHSTTVNHTSSGAVSAKATLNADYGDNLFQTFDFTKRYNINFSFWENTSYSAVNNAKVKVEGSTDGGTTWTITIVPETTVTTTVWTKLENTNVSGFNNQSNCKIRISAGYQASATYYVDDISVSARPR